MGILSELQPERVFYYFEEISKIPRGSYHTKAISDYCVKMARGLGLSVRQDAWNNVVIHKAASPGYEHAPVLMLQGHLDMVCEQEPGCMHDFEHDGLALQIEGGYVTAQGTTLGGDDGIAIAIALAILEDDMLIHPQLEVVFTTEEEVGMDGAMNLDVFDLQAHFLLNLDSEDEGVLTVGCAGGSTQELHLPYTSISVTGIPYAITVTGLAGGHSGVEIQNKRANSNKIMSTIVNELLKNQDCFLAAIRGGSKHNAIPVDAEAIVIITNPDAIQQAEAVVKQYQALYEKAYGDAEPGLQIAMKPFTPSDVSGNSITFDEFSEPFERKHINEDPLWQEVSVCEPDSACALMRLLAMLPTGVQEMSYEISGLPETSLNLAIVRTEPKEFYIELSNRSSNPAALTLLEEHLTSLASFCGAEVRTQSRYPGWQYRKDSKLREIMTDTYRRMYGKEPVIEVIHAGLECGILLSKLPHLDIVSTGPDILDIHTPKERMSIASVARTYTYVQETIRELAELRNS